MKRSILPNNFQTESQPGANDARSAHSAPEITPKTVPFKPETNPVGASRETPGSAVAAVGAHGDAPSPAPKPKKKPGPKTPHGKRAVSRNAIKHAILSPHPVVIVGLETIEEWEQFESEIVESWHPEGRYERELTGDIAFGLSRLRRCRIHESAKLSQQVGEVERELQQADAYE